MSPVCPSPSCLSAVTTRSGRRFAWGLSLGQALSVGLCCLLILACVPSARASLPQNGRRNPPTSNQQGTGQAVGATQGSQNDDGTRQYRAAAALYDRGLYDLAIDEWKKFVDTYPSHDRHAYGQHYLGISYFQAGDQKNALAQFSKLLKDTPNFDLAEQAMLYMGVSQLNLGRAGERGQVEAALATLGNLQQKFPRGTLRAEGLYYLAEAQYESGDKQKAAASYAQMLKDFADHRLAADAMYALGVTQEELNQPEAAERTYAAFLQHFSDHELATEVSMRRGEALFQKGEFASAAKLFQAAAATPGFEFADQALVRQASCLARLEQYADAAKLYAEVPRRFANSSQAAFAQLEGGKCQYLAGDFASARRALEPIAQSGGEAGAEAAHWVAQCYLKEKNGAAALATVEAALKAQPGDKAVDLMLDRADALYASADRRGEAVEAYAQIAEKYADHPAAEQAMYMASFSAHEAGNFQDAIRYATAYLRKFPQGNLAPDVLYVAAESRLQARQFPEAYQAYAELLNAYPNHANVEDWKVRQALSVFAQDKPEQTIAVLEPLARTLRDPEKKAHAFYLLGASYNREGETDRAIAALTTSLAASAHWRQADDARLELASAYRSAGEGAKAKAQLAELTKGEADEDKLARAHFLLGEIAYDGGDYQSASGEYMLVVNQWPNSAVVSSALYGLAWTQFSAQSYAEAEATAEKAIHAAQDDSTQNRARYVRGLARKAQQKYGEAAEDLRTFVSTATNQAERLDALYELGRCLTSQKQFDDARQVFTSILAEDADYAAADRVRYELAWNYKDAGDADKAAEQFTALTKEHADSPLASEALHNLGEYYYDKGEFNRAANEYFAAEQKARELAKSGVLTKERGDELGAKAVHKLGWSYYRQDNFPNAEETFAYQLRTYPQSALAGDARFMQGECAFKKQDFQKALDVLSAVKDVSNPQFMAFARYHAAQAANQLQKYDQALKAVAADEKLFAEHDLAPEAEFEKAWALNYTEKTDEALKLFEQVAGMTDREVAARARFMVGEIYFAKKQHQEAIRNYFVAAYGFGYPKWQAASHFEAGRCFEVLKKPEEAIKSYREVVDNFPDSDKAAAAQARLQALRK